MSNSTQMMLTTLIFADFFYFSAFMRLEIKSNL